MRKYDEFMKGRFFGAVVAAFCFMGGAAGFPPASAGVPDGQPCGERAWPSRLQCELDSLLHDMLFVTSQVGLSVYDLTDSTLLYACNARQRMRPASTEKLVTSISALSELGNDYRFATRLYYTGEVRERVLQGDLYVVGGFDPLFGEKDMLTLCQALKDREVDSIAGRVFADVSMKDTLIWGLGWCWDDGMPILTPLSYMKKDIFMQVFSERLHDLGIGHVLGGKARRPADAIVLAVRTRGIDEVLHPMMKLSDNFCAESVFYQLAASTGVPYASRKEAFYVIERVIGRIGFDPERYFVADGSGVSLYNYSSPELETAFLKYAYGDDTIFTTLYAALPIAGVDGTLRRRMTTGKARGNVRAKTGTVTGVSTLAGYARSGNGHMLAFCIMNQGVERAAEARAFQDKVCECLCR